MNHFLEGFKGFISWAFNMLFVNGHAYVFVALFAYSKDRGILAIMGCLIFIAVHIGSKIEGE